MNELNLPSTTAPRVVIIGCGFGGLEAAQTLSGKGFQVVVFDKNNYHTFQPLLYQVATAGLEADSIAYPIRKIFRNKKDVIFRWAEVLNIDTTSKKVYSSIGDCTYDFLIMATGATTNFFNNSEIATHAMPMKTVVESLDLRSSILQCLEQATLVSDSEKDKYLTFAVVGGGPTGIELAGALCELKNHVLPNDYPELDFTQMKILLIESGTGILQNMQKDNQQKAKMYLEDLGATLLLNTKVNGYDGHIISTADSKIECATLIWAAGIKGMPVEGLNAPEFTPSMRVKTDEYCKVESLEGVYVIGDLNFLASDKFQRGYPQVAPLAIQQGTLVANNLIAQKNGESPIPFVYTDKGSMATIGRNKAVVESGKLIFGGRLGWFAWMAVHLMQLVGFRNRVVVFINWVWNYLNYDRNIRLIIRPFSKPSSKD